LVAHCPELREARFAAATPWVSTSLFSLKVFKSHLQVPFVLSKQLGCCAGWCASLAGEFLNQQKPIEFSLSPARLTCNLISMAFRESLFDYLVDTALEAF